MAKDKINNEIVYELVNKHNELLDLLSSMNLNPLADFESLRVEELMFSDEDPENESDEFEDEDGTGFE